MIKRLRNEYIIWLVTLTRMKPQVRSRVVCYLQLKPDKGRVESPDRKLMKSLKRCLIYHTVEVHSNGASLSGKISFLIMVVASGTQNRGTRYFSLILLYCLNFFSHTYIASSCKPVSISVTMIPEEWYVIVPIF